MDLALMPIVVPAALSLIIKGFLLYISRGGSMNSFKVLLWICLIHSTAEVVTFFSYLSGADVSILFRAYYVLLIFWVGYALVYALDTLNLNKIYGYALLSVATVLSIAILATDLIVSGYVDIGYSITAVKEKMYPAYQLYIVGCLVASLFLLVFKGLRQDDPTKQIQSVYLVAGFSIPFLTILSVTVLMQMGFKINMLMLLPISTALFSVFIVLSERKHRLTDIRRLLPWSPENAYAREMNENAYLFSIGEISYKECDDRDSAARIRYQLKLHQNSVNKTAKSMGMAPSTLYYRIEKYAQLGLIKPIKDND